MTAHGLVIGKFYPPHAGHHLLIRTAAAVCDRVTVAVLGATVESIPIELRVRWLAEVHPDVTVAGGLDDHPIDYSSSEVWDLHVAEMRAVVEGVTDEPVTAVFSSESYGPELARRFGAVHVPVDPLRSLAPVSATSVRADVAGRWSELADPVRAWFCKRVVVVGAESTGTTTLSRALALHYRAPWVPEYGRELTADKLTLLRARRALAGLPVPDMTDLEWTPSDFTTVARRQVALEDRAARTAAYPLVVCDTDAFATEIWHERYVGPVSAEVARIAADGALGHRLYVLTDHAGVPFEQDGMRDGEHVRAWMTDRFAEELDKRGLRWVRVTGPHPDRLAAAVDAVDGWLAEGWRLAVPLG